MLRKILLAGELLVFGMAAGAFLSGSVIFDYPSERQRPAEPSEPAPGPHRQPNVVSASRRPPETETVLAVRREFGSVVQGSSLAADGASDDFAETFGSLVERRSGVSDPATQPAASDHEGLVESLRGAADRLLAAERESRERGEVERASRYGRVAQMLLRELESL